MLQIQGSRGECLTMCQLAGFMSKLQKEDTLKVTQQYNMVFVLSLLDIRQAYENQEKISDKSI